MKFTIGTFDQTFRFALGLALVLCTLTDLIGSWGWIGLILISTGMLRICPLYSMLGINTLGKNQSP
jgi:hypothetical protein